VLENFLKNKKPTPTTKNENKKLMALQIFGKAQKPPPPPLMCLHPKI